MSVDPLQATTADDLGIEEGDKIQDGADTFTVEGIRFDGKNLVVKGHGNYFMNLDPAQVGECDNCRKFTLTGTGNPNTPVLCVGCYKLSKRADEQ